MRRISTIPRVASKNWTVAQVFPTLTAEPASIASRSKPWNADAHTDREPIYTGPDSFNVTDNLMPGNNRHRWVGKFAVNDVKIGPTNSARGHANQNLPLSKLRIRPISENQGLPWTLEDHRFHDHRHIQIKIRELCPFPRPQLRVRPSCCIRVGLTAL